MCSCAPGRGPHAPGTINSCDFYGVDDELSQQLREARRELDRVNAANLAHRRALGWLLGHPSGAVEAATREALARYAVRGLDEPARTRTAAPILHALHNANRGGA
jgi:hypothetical protein